MTYKNIIFDLDGTISNSSPGIINALKYAMHRMNVTVADDYDYSHFIGPPIHECFKQHFFNDDADIEKAIHHFRVYYADKGWSENKMYQGMFELLIQLEESGYNLFIATNKPQVFTDLILHHFEITRFFKLIKGVDIDNHQHSKAQLIQEILDSDEGIDKSNTIMVGDSKWDVYAAAHLELPTVGVSWGFGGDKTELIAHGALTAVNSVEDLKLFLLQ